MEKDKKPQDTCQISEDEISEETKAWRKRAELKSAEINKKGQEVNNPLPNTLAIRVIIKNHSIKTPRAEDILALVKLIMFEDRQNKKMSGKETQSETFDFDCKDYYGNRF